MADHSRLFRGLRTVIYGVSDLAKAKDWYSRAFGTKPYFDEPYYVGFNIGGFELGLDPNARTSGAGGSTAYWGVDNAEEVVTYMKSVGATEADALQDVGEGIKVAVVLDPFGNRVGIIENPNFDASATT